LTIFKSVTFFFSKTRGINHQACSGGNSSRSVCLYIHSISI